jgi:uncharacterized membrane protein YphA (DoxX/SURF4 family)
MDRLVTRTAPSLYAVLRIIGALLYACHGAQKLLGLFGGVRGGTVPLLSLPGLAGVIELGAGLLIASGVLTRPAAFLASGEMAFAYWLSHGFCRKFSFEAICGMVSPSNPCCKGGERRWRSASKGPISLKTLF